VPYRRRNRTTKAEIRKHDTEWKAERAGKAIKRTRHLINTKRKSQPIHIWYTSNQLPGAPAPSDPRHHRRRNANAGHHRQTLPRPRQAALRRAHGTYTPSEALRD
jgi:hypothetical protein